MRATAIPLRPGGRGLEADHPDNERMAREVAAKDNARANALFDREEAEERLIATTPVIDDGRDHYDPVEWKWERGIR